MNTATWLAIAVLGPGALLVFIWFLADLRRLLGDDDEDAATGDALRDEDPLR